MTTDLCACGQPAEMQHPQHLTQAEYDALPEGLRPIDGYAVKPIYTCGDCALPPFCDHTAPEPLPCAICNAQPGQPCTKPDGTQRLIEHPGRTAPAPETCRHAHREDCDPAACACSPDDDPPPRAPRIVGAVQPSPPPTVLLDAAAWMAARGIDRALVRGEFRSGFTQDNKPAFLFDYVTAPDDGHGHEVVELRIVPVDGPTP